MNWKSSIHFFEPLWSWTNKIENQIKSKVNLVFVIFILPLSNILSLNDFNKTIELKMRHFLNFLLATSLALYFINVFNWALLLLFRHNEFLTVVSESVYIIFVSNKHFSLPHTVLFFLYNYLAVVIIRCSKYVFFLGAWFGWNSGPLQLARTQGCQFSFPGVIPRLLIYCIRSYPTVFSRIYGKSVANVRSHFVYGFETRLRR